ncbi:hypothetical protein YDYSY3_08550 [Paenibacillus chitinolyticus]|nr:hypothetical protein YDYSY3_08550 [Paenibacillus chitinolyticus]
MFNKTSCTIRQDEHEWETLWQRKYLRHMSQSFQQGLRVVTYHCSTFSDFHLEGFAAVHMPIAILKLDLKQ